MMSRRIMYSSYVRNNGDAGCRRSIAKTSRVSLNGSRCRGARRDGRCDERYDAGRGSFRPRRGRGWCFVRARTEQRGSAKRRRGDSRADMGLQIGQGRSPVCR